MKAATQRFGWSSSDCGRKANDGARRNCPSGGGLDAWRWEKTWVGWFGLKRPRTSVGRNGPKGWLRWETEENGNMPHKGVGRNQQWAAEILFRFKSRI
jgi:hypothetical protein